MTLVQLAIQKCLEKEALCNEFYLLLIKQTTEQPGKQICLVFIYKYILFHSLSDPNGRINIQNWRFLSLVCNVVVPRNRAILSYLQAHLRRCSLDAHTEEGKFAQFCVQCMTRTIEAKNRKYPPSQREVHCIIRRYKCYNK